MSGREHRERMARHAQGPGGVAAGTLEATSPAGAGSIDRARSADRAGLEDRTNLEDRAGLEGRADLIARARRARASMPPSLPAAGPDLLVALDIDGTLIGHDGPLLGQGASLSDAVREVIGELQRSGAHVVLATGRSVQATEPIARMLGLTETWVCCANGAVLGRWEPDGGEATTAQAGAAQTGAAQTAGAAQAGAGAIRVTDRRTFDPRPALEALRSELPGAHFAVETEEGFLVNRRFPPGELSAHERVVGFEELWAQPVSRVTMRAPELDPQDFYDIVERVGLHGVGYAVGWTAWLDVSPENVDKSTGLSVIAARLGVEPGATLAMGDGNNDVEMLRWAAHGVVMANAPAEVRAAADAVTGTVAEDGAAVVLRALLLTD